ncbi:hypothetical protein SO802_033881 [Lithocarpus litseifolius]|uniref:Uncharacterized protein n=1 Tax=Lithocarpus litseifolius TaxID=425828 RepID=A0AAW2BGE7_9ROSI
MMKTRKGEQALGMMTMEVMTKVIVVVTTAATVDMIMMTAALIVRTTAAKVMIARIVVMIGVNPLVIEKMKMQTNSIRNMIVAWTIMIKT